ncbi:hypothetical protein, partial [Listeria monocytogenes]|uniref:hypothetical protein n=1 Tax=Listeria monocytogenes TaxID=1639 RepID=UPI00350E5192
GKSVIPVTNGSNHDITLILRLQRVMAVCPVDGDHWLKLEMARYHFFMSDTDTDIINLDIC